MPSVEELIQKARAYETRVEDAVKAAREAYHKIGVEISYANERLRFKESNQYPEIYGVSYAGSMKSSQVTVGILQRAIDKATDTSDEFSKPWYKEALANVAQEPDIYRIVPYGSGWGMRISVIIGFDEAAGTISDWAHGITGYRDELGVRYGSEGTNRGLKATNYWYRKVYKNAGLANETFQNRLSYAGKPAPFWQILNSGSISLPSDRKDGSFNPVPSAPTDFIGEAEERIAE